MNRPRLGPISTGLYYRKISPKCKSFYCVHQPESGKASENDACLQASSHPVYPRTHAGSICCNHEALPETVPIGDSLTRSDDSLDHLLVRNKQWAQRLTTWNPTFFTDLSRQQSPELLWLGCSDSRVPANQIIDLLPGQVFVHRNIANIVHTTDMNCLAVLQFAVTVLKVKHIIVCGHYGCGGILAAMDKNTSCGVILDQWLEQVKEMLVLNKPQIDALP